MHQFKPLNQEILGQSCNQETPKNSTLQSKRKVRRTLLLGNSQENNKINLVIKKNLQEALSFQNSTIKK